MSAPVIDAAKLRSAISFEDLIEPVAEAFRAFSAGRGPSEAIAMYPAVSPERGDVLVKTACIPGAPIYVVKVSPWFAANVAQGRPQGGFVAAFDSETGHTLAIFNDEHYLSDIRTAAAGALAARTFAPSRVQSVTVIGSGTQAYWQVRALAHERSFDELFIVARDSAKGQLLRNRLLADIEGLSVDVTDDVRRAVQAADVLITTTPARDPVVEGRWLRPGAHITAVGADTADKCELDAACFERADLIVVDSIADAHKYGEIHRHTESGAFNGDIYEIGAILNNGGFARRAEEHITIATFAGLGVQDLAAATVALEKCAPQYHGS